MNKPFDAMRATPAEAISYFSLEETLGCVVHGIEYVWSAVRLVDRRETPGREVEVREALAESNLPFAVDLLDRVDASAEFLARLEREGMVDLSPLPTEQA